MCKRSCKRLHYHVTLVLPLSLCEVSRWNLSMCRNVFLCDHCANLPSTDRWRAQQETQLHKETEIGITQDLFPSWADWSSPGCKQTDGEHGLLYTPLLQRSVLFCCHQTCHNHWWRTDGRRNRAGRNTMCYTLATLAR